MLSRDLGYWFSGFTDGEGCFSIRRRQRDKPWWSCEFILGLRADDGPILKHLQQTTGCGTVHYHVTVHSAARPGANPQYQWHVGKYTDCLALARIFDRYPLRSKKARDFEIWKLALERWRFKDWRSMEKLAVQLREVREYNGIFEPFIIEEPPQLSLLL
jgi:hypothetical protein